MPMTLVFKRAKCFVHVDGGTKKFLAQAGPANPISVPFWVHETETFQQGIKDGSIVNLTPPTQMPGYKAPSKKEVAEEQSEVAAEVVSENAGNEDDVKQEAVPQAPFGGQPMTPVPPAPKVGGVRANSRGK